MAHTLTLLTRVTSVRVRRVSLDQGKYRVEGDVFYLLRFFLTMPSRDARQLAHRGVDGRVDSLRRARGGVAGRGSAPDWERSSQEMNAAPGYTVYFTVPASLWTRLIL